MSNLHTEVKCVKYSSTCPVWEVVGCIEKCVPNGESECVEKVELCLYAGDKVTYNVSADANVLSSSKYIVNGVLTVKNNTSEQITIVGMLVNSATASLTLANKDDTFTLGAGEMSAYSFTTFLPKGEDCENDIKFSYEVVYLVGESEEEKKTEAVGYDDGSCEEIDCKCQDSKWVFSLSGTDGAFASNDNLTESDGSSSLSLPLAEITLGNKEGSIWECSETPIKVDYVATIKACEPETPRSDCGPKSCDDKHEVSITANCVIPDVTAKLTNSTYISAKWCGCKSSKVYIPSHVPPPPSDKCSRSPGYWSTHMDIEQTPVCDACGTNPPQNGYKWPPYPSEKEYYRYMSDIEDFPSDLTQYLTPDQVCTVLSSFDKCDTKPRSSDSMGSLFRMLRHMYAVQFNLYNGVGGTCVILAQQYVKEAQEAVATYFETIYANGHYVKNQGANIFTIREDQTENEEEIRNLNDTRLSSELLADPNVLSASKVLFDNYATLFEDMYSAVGEFASCGYKACDSLSYPLKITNENKTQCPQKQIVYTIDLDVEEHKCKTSVISITVDKLSCDVPYDKQLNVKINYNNSTSVNYDVPYSGEKVKYDFEVNPDLTIVSVEISYKGTVYNLSTCSVESTDEIILIKSILGEDLETTNNCDYTTTNKVKDIITVTGNGEDECTTQVLLPSTIEEPECKSFVSSNTSIVLKSDSSSIIISSSEVEEYLTQLTGEGLDLNSLIPNGGCSFGEYKDLYISFVVNVPDCAKKVENCLEVTNEPSVGVQNPCNPSCKIESSTGLSCVTNTFVPTLTVKAKTKIANAKNVECASCNKNKTKETASAPSKNQNKDQSIPVTKEKVGAVATQGRVVSPVVPQKSDKTVQPKTFAKQEPKPVVVDRASSLHAQTKVVSPVDPKKSDPRHVPQRFSQIKPKK
jgi:hypothetical protein